MATLDLLDVATEARSAVNVTGASQDTELGEMVSGISGQFDALCGPVVVRSTTEKHDGGCTSILLRTTPLSSITTVTEYDTDGTATVLSAEDEDTKPANAYLLESRDHFVQLTRRASGADSTFASGSQNIVVVTSAGRYATTAAVGYSFKSAAKSILRAVWQQESPRWAQTPRFIDQSENDTPPAFVDVDEMIRRRLPLELIPPGLA